MTDKPESNIIPVEGKPLTAEETNALLDEAAAKKAKAENEKEQAEYYESFEKARLWRNASKANARRF